MICLELILINIKASAMLIQMKFSSSSLVMVALKRYLPKHLEEVEVGEVEVILLPK